MTYGIGEVEKFLENLLKDMKNKEERLLLLDKNYRYKSTCTIFPKEFDILYSGGIFLKIKAFDINPK